MQETNIVPHDFINVELLLPVSFNTRDMTHPYHSHHYSRHFYRRDKMGRIYSYKNNLHTNNQV